MTIYLVIYLLWYCLLEFSRRPWNIFLLLLSFSIITCIFDVCIKLVIVPLSWAIIFCVIYNVVFWVLRMSLLISVVLVVIALSLFMSVIFCYVFLIYTFERNFNTILLCLWFYHDIFLSLTLVEQHLFSLEIFCGWWPICCLKR